MKSMRQHYKYNHPNWPRSVVDALGEIKEINDLLDQGGWSKSERNWAYTRRRKLQKFINDPKYRAECDNAIMAQKLGGQNAG